jgi:hypothetical protein
MKAGVSPASGCDGQIDPGALVVSRFWDCARHYGICPAVRRRPGGPTTDRHLRDRTPRGTIPRQARGCQRVLRQRALATAAKDVAFRQKLGAGPLPPSVCLYRTGVWLTGPHRQLINGEEAGAPVSSPGARTSFRSSKRHRADRRRFQETSHPVFKIEACTCRQRACWPRWAVPGLAVLVLRPPSAESPFRRG